jgi:multidrug transporter EmrE-like cation transporter
MSAFLTTPLGKWIGIVVTVIIGAVAQTMMKLGTRQLGEFGDMPLGQYLSKLMLSPLILVAIASYGLGVILYMFLLSRLDLSFLYPVMTALGVVAATFVSAAFLHEEVSPGRILGIVVVLGGVYIISWTS